MIVNVKFNWLVRTMFTRFSLRSIFVHKCRLYFLRFNANGSPLH